MRKILLSIVLLVCCSVNLILAQSGPYKIAILSPLYLDSFKMESDFSKLPSYASPGIEFVTGAKLTIDTLNASGANVSLHILDTKGRFQNTNTLIESGTLENIDCIIANMGSAEIKPLAEYARKNKIYLISAVSPSDADQVDNPYFIMLQPKLSTHMNRLAKFTTQKFKNKEIVFIHKNTESENNAYNYFKNSEHKPICKEIIQTNDLLDIQYVRSLVKKDQENVIALGNLSTKNALENLKVFEQLGQEGYLISVIGMPTWESIRALSDQEMFRHIDVYFTSSSLIDKATSPYKYIKQKCQSKYRVNPTEVMYKGFESTYYAAQLLSKFGSDFHNHLSDNEYSFITPYMISANKSKSGANNRIDYYENKFLYIAHFFSGILTYE